MDTNDNGKIEFHEFAAVASLSFREDCDHLIERSFHELDTVEFPIIFID